MVGRCRIAGTPQVRPCRLGRGIHAAATPQSDTAPPLTDLRDLVDPRHAWMNVHRNRIFRKLIEKHPRMAWIYVSTKVDTYQPQRGRHPPRAGNAIPTDRGNLSKAGWVRLRGRERHGWRDRAYMDVLAASPATGPTPPPHRKPALASAVAVAVASAGAGRSPADPPSYCCGSRVMWMSVGVDNGMFRSARICNRLKYRSLRVPYTCRGLAT